MTAGSHTALYVHTHTHNTSTYSHYQKMVLYLNVPSSAGNRGIRPHGEDHGSDPAGVRHRARRDRIAQRRRGHHQPAAHSHSEEG